MKKRVRVQSKMSAGRSFPVIRKLVLTSIGGGLAANSVGPSLSESKLMIPKDRVQPVFSPEFERNEDFLDYDDCSLSQMSRGKETERTTLTEIKSVVVALGGKPVSEIEADCALECITADRDNLRALLPPQIDINGPRMHEIFATVKSIVTDPLMMKTMMKKMEEKNIKNGDSSSLSSAEDSNSTISSVSQTSHAPSELSTSHMYANMEVPALTWEQLALRYSCSICQDVLAAPTILNCSHNFCGSCLEDWKSSCIAQEENSVEVVQTCPMCKTEVECCIFERAFDAEICQAVDNVSDSESKSEWKSRRASYLEFRKKMECLKIQRNEPEEEEGESNDEIWETLKAWAVPVITLAVLYLVVVCRK